jgi:hypothetical protein
MESGINHQAQLVKSETMAQEERNKKEGALHRRTPSIFARYF